MSGETYKILIADDEYWCREKLIHMIDWKEYGLILQRPAQNGEEVLQRLKENPPDILITDINMPYVDGVELTRKLREEYPEIIVFVISGYDDFDYVRATMKSGAINYLLKPVSKIDLITALTEAMDILYEKRKKQQLAQEQQKKLQLVSSWLYDREYSRLIDHKENSYAAGISLEMNLDVAGYSLMLLKLHGLSDIPEEFVGDMQVFSYQMKKKICGIIGEGDTKIFHHVSKPNEFLVISDVLPKELKKDALMCMRELENTLKVPVTVAVSDHNYSMESIYSAYVQAVTLLMRRGYEHKSTLLFYDAEEEKKQREEIYNFFSEAEETQLTVSLEQGNRRRIVSLIADKLRKENRKYTYLEVKQAIKQINNDMLHYAIRLTDAQSMIDLENMSDYVEQELEHLDMDSLLEKEEDFVDSILQLGMSENAESVQNVVEQIKRYVEEHYAEDLSLSGLAQKYGVDKSYLSRCFKQTTGKNLIPYITQLRLEKGKEMIRANDLSLTEISYLIGYDDYAYFNRTFRKMEGMSPREYRTRFEQTQEDEQDY